MGQCGVFTPIDAGVGQLPALMALSDLVDVQTPEDDASATASWALAALAAPVVLGVYGVRPAPNSQASQHATTLLRPGPATLTDQNLGAFSHF